MNQHFDPGSAYPSPVRDPEMVVAALLRACHAHPDQRVMQVIRNVFRDDLIFYVEDEVAARRLSEYADETWDETD